MTKEKGLMEMLDYQLKFSSFRGVPPRKMISTIILGLAHFLREHIRKSHPSELHRNHRIQV